MRELKVIRVFESENRVFYQIENNVQAGRHYSSNYFEQEPQKSNHDQTILQEREDNPSNDSKPLAKDRFKVFHLQDQQKQNYKPTNDNNKQNSTHHIEEVKQLRSSLSLFFFSEEYFQDLYHKSGLAIEEFKSRCHIINNEIKCKPKRNNPGFFVSAILNNWVFYETEKAMERKAKSTQSHKKRIETQKNEEEENDQERIALENRKALLRQLPNFEERFEKAREQALKNNTFIYSRFMINPESSMVKQYLDVETWNHINEQG